MLQVVKRVREMFSRDEEVHNQVVLLRQKVERAHSSASHSDQMVEYVRKQVEEDERRIRDGL